MRTSAVIGATLVAALGLAGCSSNVRTGTAGVKTSNVTASTSPSPTTTSPLTRKQMVTIQEHCPQVFDNTEAYSTIESLSQSDADYVYFLGSKEDDPASCEAIDTTVRNLEADN